MKNKTKKKHKRDEHCTHRDLRHWTETIELLNLLLLLLPLFVCFFFFFAVSRFKIVFHGWTSFFLRRGSTFSWSLASFSFYSAWWLLGCWLNLFGSHRAGTQPIPTETWWLSYLKNGRRVFCFFDTREMNIVHTELCDIELKRLKKIESYQLTPSLLLLICLFVSWLHLFGSHRAETHEYQRKLCKGENGRKKN